MLLFLALCIVAVVAARVVFPKEVKEELHEELEELKDHGHRTAIEIQADKPDDGVPGKRRRSDGKASYHERLRHPAGGHQDGAPGARSWPAGRASRASAASPPSTGRCWTACWRSFRLKPDYDLDIMTPRQTLSTITSKCLTGMDEAIDALQAGYDPGSRGHLHHLCRGPVRLLPSGVRWATWRQDCEPMTSILPFRRR